MVKVFKLRGYKNFEIFYNKIMRDWDLILIDFSEDNKKIIFFWYI